MFKLVYRKLRSVEKKILDRRQKKHDALILHNKLSTYSSTIAPLPKVPQTSKKNILFFVPEAGVQPHFISSSIIAKNLEEQGHNIFFIRCFDVFERCPTLSMHNFPTENVSKVDKQKICASCIEIHQDFLTKYNLNFLDIRNFISAKEIQNVNKLLVAAPEDLRNFEYNGINFGKLAAFEMVLNTKVSDFDAKIIGHNRNIWLQLIQTALTSYIATKNLYKYYAFDILMSHNFYIGALGASLSAKEHGASYMYFCETAHINTDRSKYIILSTMFWQTVKYWKNWYQLALLPQQVETIYQDVINHFSAIGSHQYSPAAVFGSNDTLLKELNLPKNKKILVAYNSSEDESFGYNYWASVIGLPQLDETYNVFENQIAWLNEVSEFVENSNDYYLIIRLHPRLGKNKRDSKISTHYQELKQHLDKPFKNVKVIWPEEQISSYRLFDFADLALVSWSSVSIDTTRLGIPTLSYTKRIPTFPVDDIEGNFVIIANSKADYFAKIVELSQEKPTIHRISSAMRWYNMRNLSYSIDMNDIVTPLQSDLPNFKISREIDLIEKVVIGETTVLEENLRRQKSIQAPNSETEEYQSIQKILRKFIHFNIIGENLQEKDVLLQLIETDKIETFEVEDRYNAFKVFLITNGKDLRYIYVGKEYKLYSPLCANLAKLCANSIS
jgi:hypothetical protein